MDTGEVWSIDKTYQISRSIAAAKFGYGGPIADQIWTQLLALPEATRENIDQLLAAALKLGRPIYEERRQAFADAGQGDYGMTLLFASYDVAKGAGIHWIDFKVGDPPTSAWRSTANAIVAQGPHHSQQVALTSAGVHLVTHAGLSSLKVSSWTADIVAQMTILDPAKSCGPPARYRIVDALGVSETKIATSAVSQDDIRAL